jgi:hypothetical protein
VGKHVYGVTLQMIQHLGQDGSTNCAEPLSTMMSMNHNEPEVQLILVCTGHLSGNHGRGGEAGRCKPSLHAASRGWAQALQDMIDSAGDVTQVAVCGVLCCVVLLIAALSDCFVDRVGDRPLAQAQLRGAA